MTCVNCQYQWCWLCEEKYTYGHYDTGKCAGYQFTKADNLEEAHEVQNGIQNEPNIIQYVQRRIPFGIHKIFPCIYDQINSPIDLDDPLFLKYLAILGFWFFGVSVITIYSLIQYLNRNIHTDLDFAECFFVLLSGGIGIALLIPFQITFTCILTPFILISLLYHRFFDRILVFFGIGEDI